MIRFFTEGGGACNENILMKEDQKQSQIMNRDPSFKS